MKDQMNEDAVVLIMTRVIVLELSECTPRFGYFFLTLLFYNCRVVTVLIENLDTIFFFLFFFLTNISLLFHGKVKTVNSFCTFGPSPPICPVAPRLPTSPCKYTNSYSIAISNNWAH